MYERRPWLLSISLLALLSACRGSVYEDGPQRPGYTRPGDEPTDDVGPVSRCSPEEALPSAAPLRRLSEREYVNTLRDLFDGLSIPDVGLPESVAHGRFDTNTDDQVVSPLWVERSQQNAELIAVSAVAERSWMGCDARDAVTCAHEELPRLFERAYRRPLDEAERAAIVAFYDTNRSEYGEDTSLRMAVEALLISPDFLFRPEMLDAGGAPEGYAALGGHEMAARVSYLLWGSLPDEELTQAAAAGELNTTDGLEAQVRRMMADPRANGSTEAFFAQWLELGRLETATSDTYPEFTPDMRNDLRASVLRFVDHAFWEERSFDSLMRGSYGFVNDRLAPVFGVPAPGGDALVYTDLEPGERSGILTQPGWLASSTHGATHSPIIRGLFVVRNVLCDNIDPPPPDVTSALPDETPGETQTTRQLIEMTHGSAGCQTCHARIDGVGFAFENYDAVGRFRTEENGAPVDPTAEVLGAGDANGEYASALDLVDGIAGSETVRDCMVTQLYRFSMGRPEQSADACQIDDLSSVLRDLDDPAELLVALALSPSFRYRPLAEEEE